MQNTWLLTALSYILQAFIAALTFQFCKSSSADKRGQIVTMKTTQVRHFHMQMIVKTKTKQKGR